MGDTVHCHDEGWEGEVLAFVHHSVTGNIIEVIVKKPDGTRMVFPYNKSEFIWKVHH